MKNIIEELRLEIEHLKQRVSILEKEDNQNLNASHVTYKSNSYTKENYYKEEHESGIKIKSLKEVTTDRFGKIAGVNVDVKKDLEENKIDFYEYNIMLHLAVANQDYVGIKYIMNIKKLEFEQAMELLNKLKKLGHIQIIRTK